jgi:hypothetical protein
MKIKFVIAGALMLSMGAYAQKKEIKAIENFQTKLSRSKEAPTQAQLQEYKNLVDAAEATLAFADKDQQIDIYFQKGMYYLSIMEQMKDNPSGASEAFYHMKDGFDHVIELENSPKGKQTKLITDELYPRVKATISLLADELGKMESYSLASEYYYTAYGLDEKDHAMLYMAAANATNGKEYEKALNHYLELDKTGWTGEGKAFTAVNKETNLVDQFPNEASRDIAIKTGSHTKPEVKVFPSMKPEIARNIALLYIELGQADKAKGAMANARRLNPNDISLIVSEASIFEKAGDTEGAKKLINDAIAKQPNNPELYYYLGNMQTDAKLAEEYLVKATQIKPDYFEAYAMLGDLKVRDDQKLTDEMNALGNTPADTKKFAELKKVKEANYKASVAYLEKAYALQPDNQYVISMLASLYQALEMEDKYKEFKAKQE